MTDADRLRIADVTAALVALGSTGEYVSLSGADIDVVRLLKAIEWDLPTIALFLARIEAVGGKYGERSHEVAQAAARRILALGVWGRLEEAK